MTEAKLVKTIYLDAPRARVWTYLTEPEKLARWFHEGRETMKAGSDYALLRENPDAEDKRLLWGDVLETDEPNRLVYTFSYHGGPKAASVVEWTLTDLADGTVLTMTHTFDAVEADRVISEMKGTDRGWDEHLTRLRNLIN